MRCDGRLQTRCRYHGLRRTSARQQQGKQRSMKVTPLQFPVKGAPLLRLPVQYIISGLQFCRLVGVDFSVSISSSRNTN